MDAPIVQRGLLTRFDRRQRIALLVGGVLVVASLLFPPWEITYSQASAPQMTRPAGRMFLLTAASMSEDPKVGLRLAIEQIVAQLLAIALGTAVAVGALGTFQGRNVASVRFLSRWWRPMIPVAIGGSLLVWLFTTPPWTVPQRKTKPYIVSAPWSAPPTPDSRVAWSRLALTAFGTIVFSAVFVVGLVPAVQEKQQKEPT